MDLTRTQKNRILIAVNLIFTLLIIFKIHFSDAPIGMYWTIWIVSFPIIMLAHMVPTENNTLIKARDICLFLLTGGAIGKILGSIVKQGTAQPIFILWLFVAIIAVIIHYSPSKKDRYMN